MSARERMMSKDRMMVQARYGSEYDSSRSMSIIILTSCNYHDDHNYNYHNDEHEHDTYEYDYNDDGNDDGEDDSSAEKSRERV
jgi:hypothetical protein